ncbi:N-6 DNA methylase [Streptomyces sp. AV19]|uniref:N-6 DNA methylase n=1 Tax=Streptomyces sp. AV19 TaxID=2793068 RepID=UPI0018FE2F9C|nr:N-6 DNA methylase [Streptomyces sp. AV19]MBH1936942.1 N-6 DNA methylase [Streptomyces sp. AV19]MDG4532997.1 SAM-dependent methyltransferase [Streptomyces sp. AV19]
MEQQDEPVMLSLAGIARLAGVGRAAVSNWRRRHSDFPEPVGGTDASPMFSLTDTESWLLRHSKIDESSGGWDRLWPRIEDLGDRDGMAHLLASAGERLAIPTMDPPPGAPEPGTADRSLADEVVRLARRQSPEEAFAVLLDRWHALHVRQLIVSPRQLADTMVGLAAELRDGSVPVRQVLDPACGMGSLLAASGRRWSGQESPPVLAGVDNDAALARLTRARLALEFPACERHVRSADTLRDAPLRHASRADVVLSYPPSNQRSWGHDELATDPRWLYGVPPRTEPELAWVQHCLSVLAPGGVAVLVLPPGVASRRAGRRIRAGLVRTGSVRAVVALPPGSAAPHGVGLHLWLLTTPRERPGSGVSFIDAADCRTTALTGRGTAVDWDGLRQRTVAALRGSDVPGATRVPAMELLSDDVDLTPSRRTVIERSVGPVELRRAWGGWDNALMDVRDAAKAVREHEACVAAPDDFDYTFVGDLERSGALDVTAGKALADDLIQQGARVEGALHVVTPWVVRGEEPWVSAAQVAGLEAEGQVVLTSFGDVVVVTAAGGFDVWVETVGPRLLGAHTVRLRTDSALLDPFFLAACLRAPGNDQRAGTRASSSSRVDVRRLRVLRAPTAQQRRIGEAYRQLVRFRETVADLGRHGELLSAMLSGLLAQGRLTGE